MVAKIARINARTAGDPDAKSLDRKNAAVAAAVALDKDMALNAKPPVTRDDVTVTNAMIRLAHRLYAKHQAIGVTDTSGTGHEQASRVRKPAYRRDSALESSPSQAAGPQIDPNCSRYR